MSGWQAGDLALTVWDGIQPREPKRGRIYTVAKVVCDERGVGLVIDEVPNFNGHEAWDSSGFLRVTPPSEQIKERRGQEVEA